MLDFITAPLVTGIVFYSIYKTFELFVRRNERMAIINKMADKAVDGATINLPNLNFETRTPQFLSLRFGTCMLGIGFGLLVGFIVSIFTYPNGLFEDYSSYSLASLVMGSCVLLFAGIAMLIAFVIERKLVKKE